MAAKAKDKKEKGKKGKNKGEKPRQDSVAEMAMIPAAAPPVAATSTRASATATSASAAALTATSDAILDAVLECVAHGGIEGLTTRRIAAQAGVNEVTIFRHFGSKDGLLDAVFARETARMKGSAIQYSANLEADLVRIVTVLEEILVRRAGVLPVLLEVTRRKTANNDKVNGKVNGKVIGTGMGLPLTFDEATSLLDRYIKEGKLRREQPQQTLAALAGPLVLGSLLAPAANAETHIDARAHVRAFLHGRATT